MNEVYAAHYRRCSAGAPWQLRSAPSLWTLEALQSAWRAAPPAAVAGSALAAFGDRLDPGGAARRLDAAAPRAAALLTLAGRAWAAGEAVPAAQALPLYLRDKVALTIVEREALQAARSAAA